MLMNFEIWLKDIYIEAYPLITNARLNVEISHYIDTPPFNGPAHLCDSDVDFYGESELDFDPLWGETHKESGKWVALTADQLNEICGDYADEIEEQIKEYIEELKYDYA